MGHVHLLMCLLQVHLSSQYFLVVTSSLYFAESSRRNLLLKEPDMVRFQRDNTK